MATVEITKEEQSAILSLKRLARKWPQSLSLFSWSGSLKVFKNDSDGIEAAVVTVDGIPNDGGDPTDINQFAEIIWPSNSQESEGNKQKMRRSMKDRSIKI